MQRDSVANTLLVAALLCVVCSVLVSGAAVGLRDRQEKNRVAERKRNILKAAGLYDPEVPLTRLFERVETRVVDLASGKLVSESEIDPQTFDQQAAAKNPATSVTISREEDIAGIGRRAKHAVVYLIRDHGQLDQVVLPVRGKGLWSTLYGFLALDRDLRTIRGLTFYEHAETPGLGGEVDNPRWKEKWVGKLAFGEDGQPQVEVIHGTVDSAREEAQYQVDGLAGATITSRGVTHLLRYWLGDGAFGPFLKQLQNNKSTA